MPDCWIFLLKRRRALSNVSFSPTRTSANPGFTSSGCHITDEDGNEYLDFFAGAGALSYGHNNPLFVNVAIDHLRSGRLLHSLDTFTAEKRDFLESNVRYYCRRWPAVPEAKPAWRRRTGTFRRNR